MKKEIKAAIADYIPFFFSQPALIWQILFFYVPLLFILFISFKHDDTALLSDFTLDNYAALFSMTYALILARSLALAGITSILCLAIGYPVAFYIARRVKQFKNVYLFFLILPFWTNMLVQIYAWFAVLEYKGLINTVLLNLGLIAEPLSLVNNRFAVYLVMVYYYLPFMIIPIYTVLEKLDEAYIEASRDLGATRWQTFFHVIVPLSMSGILTGLFLVFVPAFGEFVIPGLMGGSKYMYVGTLISYYYLVARNEPLGAACTVLSCLVLIVVAYLLYRCFARFLTSEGAL